MVNPGETKRAGAHLRLFFMCFFFVVPCGVVFVIVGMLERGDDVCEYGVSTLLKRIKSRRNEKKNVARTKTKAHPEGWEMASLYYLPKVRLIWARRMREQWEVSRRENRKGFGRNI